jgi:hypothetical protein
LIPREARVEVDDGITIVSRDSGRGRRWCDSVNGLRKRMVVACYEGGVEAVAPFELATP